MQKASFYDGSTLFGAYSYSGTNGFAYEGPQQPFQAPAHMESDFQRSSCSLQSLGSAAPLAKAKELNGSCMRPGLPAEPPRSPAASNASSAGNGPAGGGKNAPGKGNLSSSASGSLSKQIFPWMKESRQNSKHKNGSPSAGSAATPWGRAGASPFSEMTARKNGKKIGVERGLRVAKGWRDGFGEGLSSPFPPQRSKESWQVWVFPSLCLC